MPPEADRLLGEWWTKDREGRVRFVRGHGGTYEGPSSYSAPKPDNPTHDVHNPDPSKRGRPIRGIVLVSELAFQNGRYEKGRVYNPRDGRTFGFEAEFLDDQRLKVRGFVGFRLLGATQTWTRYAASGER